MASRLEIQEVLDDGDYGSASWCGLSDRHAALIRDKSLSFLSLGPQDQMFVRSSGGACAWVDGPSGAVGEGVQAEGQGL